MIPLRAIEAAPSAASSRALPGAFYTMNEPAGRSFLRPKTCYPVGKAASTEQGRPGPTRGGEMAVGREVEFNLTLQELPKPTPATIVAAAAVLLVRVGLALASDRFVSVPNGELDSLSFGANQAQYELTGRPAPKVLLIGTSHFFYLPAHRVAEELGLPAGGVFRISLLPGRFWVYNAFLRRNPDLLRECESVVIDVLPMSLHEPPKEQRSLTTTFLRYATISERLRAANPFLRAQALADAALPAWSLRTDPRGWRVFLTQLDDERLERFKEYTAPGGAAAEVRAGRNAVKRGADEIISVQAPNTRPDPIQEAALRDLIASFSERCQIVFVVLPLRSDFTRAIHEDARVARSFAGLRAALERVSAQNVRIAWHDALAGVALSDHDFIDPDHMTPAAVVNKLPRILADLVRDRGGASNAPNA